MDDLRVLDTSLRQHGAKPAVCFFDNCSFIVMERTLLMLEVVFWASGNFALASEVATPGLIFKHWFNYLDFDHGLSEEMEADMEEEELLLKNLGWKGKWFIKSSCDAKNDGRLDVIDPDGRKKAVFDSTYRSLNISSCDMDGTLLNSKRQDSLAK